MRFLKWVLNKSFAYKTKYLKKKASYEKSLKSKIFTIFKILGLTLGTLAFGYFVIPLSIKTNGVIVFISIILYISLIVTTAQNLVMYGIAAFRTAAISTVGKFIDGQINKQVEQNHNQEYDEGALGEDVQVGNLENKKPKQKYYRWLDILIGIMSFVFLVAFIVFAIIVAYADLVLILLLL